METGRLGRHGSNAITGPSAGSPARGTGPEWGTTVRRLLAALLAVGLAGAGACADAPSTDAAAATDGAAATDAGPPAPEAPFEWPAGEHRTATLEVEGLGTIRIELYPELAPENVGLFEKLTGLEYYDGTTFHRVIPDFMIQGGDPNTRDENPRNDGTGSSGFRVADEFGTAPPVRGAVGMANRGRPRTGSGQFFILQQDAPHLADRYSFFGRVVEGMGVIDRIARVECDATGRWGPKNRPIENVVVSKVRLSDPEALARN